IKPARSPPVIEALQKRDEHEVVAVAKLNRANHDLNERDQNERQEQINPPFCRGKNEGDEKINHQSAQDREKIRSCDRGHGRKPVADQNVTEENRRGAKTNAVRWRLWPS